MMPDEKEQLLTLLGSEAAWCREAEAHDAGGSPVCYDDAGAVAWDITGALCRLFGWRRASVLFEQFDRHFFGKRRMMAWPVRDVSVDAMVALQDFNDRRDTSFATLRRLIETMPVWSGAGRQSVSPGE